MQNRPSNRGKQVPNTTVSGDKRGGYTVTFTGNMADLATKAQQVLGNRKTVIVADNQKVQALLAENPAMVTRLTA